MTESEEALVQRAKVDRQAFGQLYQCYVERIYSYIYYRVGNASDAEDLTATTFQRALDNLDRYESRGLPFSSWLYRIAHNAVANWHRSRSRRQFISLDEMIPLPGGPDHADQLAIKNEERDALFAALRRLPAERQQLLILKHSLRLSNQEIGQIMDRSEGAIKSLYHRTLLGLREELQALGFGARAPADEP